MAALALPAAQPNKSRTEAELKQLRQRIERLQRQAQNDAEEKDRQARDLRVAEQAVNKAQGELGKVRSQRSERSTARAKLEAERLQREAERQRTQSDLAAQLRSSYMMGRAEPLKMVLNQRSPTQFRRNLTYYGYLGRLRAGQIAAITENIARIDELTDKIDEEDAELADNMAQQKKTLEEREAARRQRNEALAAIKREAGSRAEELRRLQVRQKQAEQQLEQLLERLRREAESPPADPNSPFAARKGKLSWPVAGRIAAGKSVSDGIEIDAARGSEVRAVHGGTVIHAALQLGAGVSTENQFLRRHCSLPPLRRLSRSWPGRPIP